MGKKEQREKEKERKKKKKKRKKKSIQEDSELTCGEKTEQACKQADEEPNLATTVQTALSNKRPRQEMSTFTNGNPTATARPPPAFANKREKSQAGPRPVSESAMHTASATDSVESLATPDTPGGSRPGRHRGLENRNNSAKLSVSADVNQPPSGEHRGSSRQLLNVEGNKYNTIHNNSQTWKVINTIMFTTAAAVLSGRMSQLLKS